MYHCTPITNYSIKHSGFTRALVIRVYSSFFVLNAADSVRTDLALLQLLNPVICLHFRHFKFAINI